MQQTAIGLALDPLYGTSELSYPKNQEQTLCIYLIPTVGMSACRLQDLSDTTMELEQYLVSSTAAQQAAIGLALDPLHGAPGQPGEADLPEEPSAPPMPQEPIIITERLKPGCPLCLESIQVMACGPCG